MAPTGKLSTGKMVTGTAIPAKPLLGRMAAEPAALKQVTGKMAKRPLRQQCINRLTITIVETEDEDKDAGLF